MEWAPGSGWGSRRAMLALSLSCALMLTAISAMPVSPAEAVNRNKRARRAVDTSALLRSRLLWSTIDVCNAPDQPNTVGIRGSMPGDHQAHDKMYMRFRLQYMNAATKTWTDLSKASAGYAAVGSGAAARQAGRSFQLNPVAGQPAFTLRGVVNFQWRHGSTVLAQVSRATSAGRDSLAGSDPAGFSAASCLIG
ncbi:MAG TPA: hypothetical protein VLJ80_13145 [Solirubrobacteraceae bacterium]|nr:hypothetical protein [Solirubrobacteraceae bacterium]